jgi:hypothetical protein
MAVEAQAAPATTTVVRPKREREQELLVWPDLVFVEFICAVVFTLAFVILSSAIDAPLLNRANLDITPNPSKAAWYLVALQELLLHMHPALGGVIAPTIGLGIIAAMPYIDRSNDGQGVWFGTPNAIKITLFSAAFASIFSSALVLYDQGRHVNVITNVVQHVDKDWEWPEYLAPFANVRSIQTGWTWHVPVPERAQLGGGNIEHDGQLDWPDDFTHVPMPFNGTSGPDWMRWDKPTFLPGWMQALYWYDLNMNTPAFFVEILIPVAVMVILPIIMLLMLKQIGWLLTTRDVMIAVFTGMMVVYFVLTIIGAGFRGAGQDLVMPWDVPDID